MNIFRRLFKIGQSEANSAIDKMEDPIKMTEQGIRDMKIDLEKSLESLAQVKALAIRSTTEINELTAKAEDYQQKAMLILKKAQKKELDSQEADRLAKEALVKKEETIEEITALKSNSEKYQNSVATLEGNVQELIEYR